MKNNYEIRGDYTAIFLLRKSGEILETLIDTIDLEKAMEFPHTWYAHWNRFTESYYVHGSRSKDKNGKRGTVILHRLLMGTTNAEHIDHINNDTLDNRRSINLREASFAENMQNVKGPYKNNKCGIKGVYWDKKAGKWKAQIKIDKKVKFLGYFLTKEEAGKKSEEARAAMMPFSKEASSYIRSNSV